MDFNIIIIHLLIVELCLNIQTGKYNTGPMLIAIAYILAVLTRNRVFLIFVVWSPFILTIDVSCKIYQL